ncbi:putative HTLV-1-related endogenous sequence [Melanerpes formicivorus]|uniref:putative HTLV-1-related endogenous sequence n=1 Tax=Melanerpes formicivorus TaxID=211600 RepID=UPI00358F90E3
MERKAAPSHLSAYPPVSLKKTTHRAGTPPKPAALQRRNANPPETSLRYVCPKVPGGCGTRRHNCPPAAQRSAASCLRAGPRWSTERTETGGGLRRRRQRPRLTADGLTGLIRTHTAQAATPDPLLQRAGKGREREEREGTGEREGSGLLLRALPRAAAAGRAGQRRGPCLAPVRQAGQRLRRRWARPGPARPSFGG